MENITITNKQTTDATPLVIIIKSLLPSSASAGLIVLLGRDASGNVRRWLFFRTVKRVGTGSAVLVGTAPTVIGESDAGTSGWVATLGVSGTGLIVTVTGVAGVTI